MSAAHARRGLERLPEAAIVNAYGPTETTVFACCYRVPADFAESAASVPIGGPIGNTEVYVLDPHGQPVPVGVAGELYIGGPGLARGYLKRPQLTDEKFVRHPFSRNPEARLYRTGDLVRWLPDGKLDFLGRIDDQVKIRGYRIELGEIESVLNRHPQLKQASVLAWEERPGERRLVAYVVPADGQEISGRDLHLYLVQKLPEYMVPTLFVPIEQLPLSPNGKVNRQKLPLPGAGWYAGEYLPPRDRTEQVLANIWEELLKLERVGVHDDFFDLGGHSLIATRMVSKIQREFGVTLPLQSIFEAPTIAGLADLIRR
jgi:acyl-CoA synthetase (AMP-forming)/AMP-acid ligase II/acyl carrier protein